MFAIPPYQSKKTLNTGDSAPLNPSTSKRETLAKYLTHNIKAQVEKPK